MLRIIRSPLVASSLVLLVLAGAVATFATRERLLIRLDDRIDDDLQQEIREITTLVHAGRDPETAQRFASLARVYTVFFRRNVRDTDQALVSFVGNRLWRVDLTEFAVAAVPADALTAWRRFSTRALPGEQLTGRFLTPEGSASYRAIQLQAGREKGAFVVAILPVTERAEIREVQRYAAIVAVVLVLIAGVATWFFTRRRPPSTPPRRAWTDPRLPNS